MTTTINLPRSKVSNVYTLFELVNSNESAFVCQGVLYLINGRVYNTSNGFSWISRNFLFVVDYFCDIAITVKRKQL